MERGAYFDAWFPLQHNYHPSFPPRRLRMIDHLEDYRATMLVWAALGGGNLALPYLEEEAFGEVPPRYRVYGFVNDAEFIAECGRRGIKVFGVVFEHAWEYPVELNEDESRVLALNETRGAGRRDWLGIREFWQDRYPRLWPPRSKWFPEPVLNADGEEVTDILEECAQRDIHGRPCHALWIECPDREHWNWMMDRNNPVWRQYLKAIVRLQIDAGCHGIHFDEAEVPITSLQYGGCFCRTCMRGFTEHLQALPPDALPEELRGQDLAAFHYGEWLLARGHDFASPQAGVPLFGEYMAFQRANITSYFAELAAYAREYAASLGRDIQVSGNFFNLFDNYYALEPAVDVIVTEMRNTTYRQPAWYRYAAGFGGAKPVVVVENPYGGVVPELVENLKRGRAYDRFRQSLYEAAALGVNMSVPYGAWMGSVIEDAFYPPHDLAAEIQAFLAGNERLFSTGSWSEVGVVFSVGSSFRAAPPEVMGDNRLNLPPEGRDPFWEVCEALSAALQPYDVVFFPDGELRPDTLGVDDLRRYRTLVLPGCAWLTARQAELLGQYLASGGRLVVCGPLGENLAGQGRARLLEDPGTGAVGPFGFSLDLLAGGPQVVVAEGRTDAALTLQAVEGGAALHLVRYDYDLDADRVPVLERLVLEVRLPFDPARATAHSPDGALSASVEPGADGRARVVLGDAGVYGIVHLVAGEDR
ncbi:MAG TPA: hypothetical protein VG637_09635 [Actinomycetes bacterium]|nr:hypothetical protein [Actinomycetes bacterium]